MICAFCGEPIEGRPVIQDGQMFCSLGCADMAAENDFEGNGYDEEDGLDLNYSDEYDEY